MVSINNLTVEFSAKALFSNIGYVINPHDRIALVGKNGAGKSTMLKIIAGLQAPTSGSISYPRDMRIGYLPQQMQLTDTLSVVEEVKKAFAHIDILQKQVDRLTAEISDTTDYESPRYQQLIDELTYLTERLHIEQSENSPAEIEKTLIGLGFTRTDFDRPTSEFSGGWRMRIELAKILLQRPDLLLLDEPTNHLDIESIQWLEQWLMQKGAAVMLVSHDRAFLDNVTNRTIEISLGKIYDYNVSYSKFVVLRQERLEQQQRAYANQQKQIHDTEQFIERFRYKATKSVQVQSRIKQLSKIERIEIDEIDTSHISLKFPPAPRSGDFPVIAENIGKSYGEHEVFSGVDFTLRRGEKVAFVGKNGQGKSTFVKCILNEIPYDGILRIGHGVEIGYFAQNQASLLDPELTVFDTIDRVATGPVRTHLRDILGAFMFGGEASDKKVKVLSGGEKTRLAMIRLLLHPVNLLILDEPTNHLDMVTKDVLKQAIRQFTGTAIIVSHDREFLDTLVDKVYEFADGKVREHIGGIYDYLNSRNPSPSPATAAPDSRTAKTEPSKTQPTPSGPQQETSAKPSAVPPSYAMAKEQQRLRRQLTKKVEQAEAAVAEAEQKVAELETMLASEAYDPELYARHAEAQKQLENAMSLWEIAAADLEQLASL